MIALARASALPTAIWAVDLWGKEPLFLSVLPEKSTDDMRMIPASDARTPMSFLAVKCSTLIRAPKRRVQMPSSRYISQGYLWNLMSLTTC